MTKLEYSAALERAYARKGEPFCCGDQVVGFALPGFEPVAATLNEMADLIRWQCFTFSGGIDGDALNEIWKCRSRFIVIGGGELL